MKDKKETKETKKPDETASGSIAAHLKIKDKKTGKYLLNTRG